MRNNVIGSMLALVLAAATPAWAQDDSRFHKGRIEVAGFSGLLLQRQTFEDPDFPEDNFTMSASTIGGDATYYLSPRLGVGLYLTRQSLAFGPDTAKFTTSGTLVGPQFKYRVPMSGKVSVALAGAGGFASNGMTYKGSEVESFDEIDETTDGKFFMLGAMLSFFLADQMSVDTGLRYQFTRVTSGTGVDASKMNASGFLGGVGFTLYFK